MHHRFLPACSGIALLLLLTTSACRKSGEQSAGPLKTATSDAASPAAVNVTIFTGGDPSVTSTLYSDIKAGVYTTVVLWDGHVSTTGDLNFNDSSVTSGGSWVSTPSTNAWLSQVQSLKTSPTTITRVELSLGGEATTFANIESLINEYGTGPTSPLYKTFSLLHTQLGLDAIDYDDESQYNASSSEAFAQMCVTLGMHVSICPYTNTSYWVSLVKAINKTTPGTLDAIYLQCYDGGAGNSPSSWNSSFSSTGLRVCPGMWAMHGSTCSGGSTTSQVQTQMAAWEATTQLAGGFMYNGNEMEGCPANGSPAQYATAIKNGL